MASAPSLPGGLLIRDHNRPVRSLLLAELLRILVGGVNRRKVIELLSHPLRPEPGRNLLRRDRIRTACDAVPLVRSRFYDISILPERLDRFPDSCPGNSEFFTERLAGYIVILISQRPEHLFLHEPALPLQPKSPCPHSDRSVPKSRPPLPKTSLPAIRQTAASRVQALLPPRPASQIPRMSTFPGG